jgi:hypothetical protein
LSDVPTEHLRDKLLALAGSQVTEAEVARVLVEVLVCGGGVTLDLDELRLKLIRREGKLTFKKEDARRASSMPPRDRR